MQINPADLEISSASLFWIPNCNQSVLAPTLMAFFAISGVSFDGLKTFTMSIWEEMSSNFSTIVSPLTFFPTENGFTGITLLNNHEAYRQGTIFSRLDDLELIAFNEVVTVDDKEHINQNAYINDLEFALAGLTPDVVDRSLFNDIVAYE